MGGRGGREPLPLMPLPPPSLPPLPTPARPPPPLHFVGPAAPAATDSPTEVANYLPVWRQTRDGGGRGLCNSSGCGGRGGDGSPATFIYDGGCTYVRISGDGCTYVLITYVLISWVLKLVVSQSMD